MRHRSAYGKSGPPEMGKLNGGPRRLFLSPLAASAPPSYDRIMATNTGAGSRKGAVKDRVQALNPVTKRYVKIDTSTGRIVDHKRTAGPYKGVREVTRKTK